MSKQRLIACLIPLFASGCVTNGPARIEVVDTGCAWTRPVYVSNQDVLTEKTATQILVHNETWELRCSK